MFCRCIDVPPIINSMSGNRSNVDNMSLISFNHGSKNSSRDIQETFYVGIDHHIPVADLGVLHQVRRQRETRIIDQYIDLDVLFSKFLKNSFDLFILLNIKLKRYDGYPMFLS